MTIAGGLPIVKIDDETLALMRKHNIAESDVFDAGPKPRSYWKDEMQKAAKRFVYVGSPCMRGHRLRRRSGQCAICNPHSNGFAGHHHSSGTVYVAASEATGYVKVGGVVGPAEGRAATLNRQSYGGLTDWRIVYTQRVERVGNVESLARGRIKDFQVRGQTYRGDQRQAREMFNCSIATAVEAVKRAADSN